MSHDNDDQLFGGALARAAAPAPPPDFVRRTVQRAQRARAAETRRQTAIAIAALTSAVFLCGAWVVVAPIGATAMIATAAEALLLLRALSTPFRVVVGAHWPFLIGCLVVAGLAGEILRARRSYSDRGQT